MHVNSSEMEAALFDQQVDAPVSGPDLGPGEGLLDAAAGEGEAPLAPAARTAGSLEDRVRALAESIVAREGCELYDVEIVGGGGNRIVRVYVDKADGGAGIEDCSNVSRGLNLLLDVEDVIPGGAYNLEVSTPGLERVLRQRWHFERAIGKTIAVKTFAPLADYDARFPELAKARQIKGELVGLTEGGVWVRWAGAPARAAEAEGAAPDAEKLAVHVPFDGIAKAHVVFQFEEGTARPAGAKKPGRNDAKKEKRKK